MTVSACPVREKASALPAFFAAQKFPSISLNASGTRRARNRLSADHGESVSIARYGRRLL
jgi:hypothetical protein